MPPVYKDIGVLLQEELTARNLRIFGSPDLVGQSAMEMVSKVGSEGFTFDYTLMVFPDFRGMEDDYTKNAGNPFYMPGWQFLRSEAEFGLRIVVSYLTVIKVKCDKTLTLVGDAGTTMHPYKFQAYFPPSTHSTKKGAPIEPLLKRMLDLYSGTCRVAPD